MLILIIKTESSPFSYYKYTWRAKPFYKEALNDQTNGGTIFINSLNTVAL